MARPRFNCRADSPQLEIWTQQLDRRYAISAEWVKKSKAIWKHNAGDKAAAQVRATLDQTAAFECGMDIVIKRLAMTRKQGDLRSRVGFFG